MKKHTLMIIIGLLLMFTARNPFYTYDAMVIAAAIGGILFICGLALALRYRRIREAQIQAERAAVVAAREQEARIREQAVKAEQIRRESERVEAEARRTAWEATHGRIVTALAGVTYKNDDGSSRQAILKDIKARDGDADLELEEYEYKGKPAIRVLVDGECVGVIPRNHVSEILEVMDRVTASRLDVETFRPEEEIDEDGNVHERGELIYRADLTLVYTK